MTKTYITFDNREYIRPPAKSSDVWRIQFKDGFTSTKLQGYVGYVPRSTLVEAISNIQQIQKSENKESKILEVIKRFDDPTTVETRGQLFIYEPSNKTEPLQTIGVFGIDDSQ